MSKLCWRWYNTSPTGALLPFNDDQPHVPNEPVKAHCLTHRWTRGIQQYVDVATGQPFNPAGVSQSIINQMLATNIIRKEIQTSHDAPVYGCSCGHYVFKWSEDAIGLPYVRGYRHLCKVIAVVEVWGRMIEHDLGYRAEYSQLRGVCSFGRKVHPVYEVDRARSVEELIARWEEVE